VAQTPRGPSGPSSRIAASRESQITIIVIRKILIDAGSRPALRAPRAINSIRHLMTSGWITGPMNTPSANSPAIWQDFGPVEAM
jgi:hypothetical protein